MDLLLNQMLFDMQLKGFSPKTQSTYVGHIIRFQRYFNKPIDLMGYNEIREFLHYSITVRKLSSSFVNSAYSALRFMYETTLQRNWDMHKVPRVRKQKKLPVVLSPEEVSALFESTCNLKHKAILMTTYSAGLRVAETAALHVSDIDSKNMQIVISQGKGRKDRYSLLSKTNLLILRKYFRQYHPSLWLFPGQEAGKPISTRTIQQVFHDAKVKAGINKAATVHTLGTLLLRTYLKPGLISVTFSSYSDIPISKPPAFIFT